MEFKTQAELLRHLGKNENDRSLVQRMVIRGEVLKENGGYILTNKDEKIQELEKEVEKLRSEIATIKASNWDLDEAKQQREYYERLYNEESEDKDKRIFKAFQWIKQRVRWADWDEFHDWIMSDEEE